METKTLREIGLTDSEIKVYFALLELESSTVGKIIEKSKISDSEIYSILEKLKEKGLVGFVIKNNVKHFQASDPKNLIRLLEDREKQILEQKAELQKNVIPLIEQKRKLAEEKQECVVYESYEGVKAAFNLILDTVGKDGEYRVFALGSVLREPKIIRFFDWFHKRRIERGVRGNALSNIEFKDAMQRWNGIKGFTIRLTDQKIPIGTFIFKNHVMTVLWTDKPAAFVIKSKKNYEYYKEFFEDAWKSATSNSMINIQEMQVRKQLDSHKHEKYLIDIELSKNTRIPDFVVNQKVMRPERMASMILAKWLFRNSYLYKGKVVMDMGSGSGIQGVVAGIYGARKVIFSDITREAIENTKENIQKYNLQSRSSVFQGNLFGRVKEKFDVIIFNHPFFSRDEVKVEKTVLSISMVVSPQLIHKFFEDAKNHLKRNGFIIMPFFHLASEANNPEIQAPKHGYSVSELFSMEMDEGLQKGKISIYRIKV